MTPTPGTGRSAYFYMRALWHYNDGTLGTLSDEKGSVTKDPVTAYKRYWQRLVSFDPPELRSHRGGHCFAVWELPEKLPLREAAALARTSHPTRIYVVTHGWSWSFLQLDLPPGQRIEFKDRKDPS